MTFSKVKNKRGDYFREYLNANGTASLLYKLYIANDMHMLKRISVIHIILLYKPCKRVEPMPSQTWYCFNIL